MKKKNIFRSQWGVSLIESLVALVVTSLGVLGILGMQMRTLADSQITVRRAQAVRLIEDLSERIQINPGGSFALQWYVADWGDAASQACTSCSNQELAKKDVYQWKTTVQKTLPLGDARIFFSAAEVGGSDENRRQLGVIVSWRENERHHLKADGSKDSAYTVPFNIPDNGDISGACPENSICHLQYIYVVGRCMPYQYSGENPPPIYCP